MYKINEELKNVDAFRFGYDPMPVWFLEFFRTELNNEYSSNTQLVRYANDWLTIETIATVNDRNDSKKTTDYIEIKHGQWVCKYMGTDSKIRVFADADFKKQFVKCDKLLDCEIHIYVAMFVIVSILIIAMLANLIFF